MKNVKAILMAVSYACMIIMVLGFFGIHIPGVEAAPGVLIASIPVHGDFSCADLQVIQAKAEMIFQDDVRAADVTPYSDAAIAVIENQTANFTFLKNPDKDRVLRIDWIQACDKVVRDCTSQCDLDGEEAGAFCQDYALDICLEVPFAVTQERFRTSTLNAEEVVAREMAESLKAMDEKWAQLVVGHLVMFAGQNALTTPSSYVVSPTKTTIPAAAWNTNINGYLAMAMDRNKMRGMYMLSGSQLWLANWMANMEQGNADGKGAAAKMKTFKMYFDQFNVDSTAGEPTTFLINPASVAVVTKTRFSSTPIEVNGDNIRQKRYTVDSPSLPGVSYDVYYGLTCINDDIKYMWKIVARGGIFQNPFGCEAGRTGVLQFVCG